MCIYVCTYGTSVEYSAYLCFGLNLCLAHGDDFTAVVRHCGLRDEQVSGEHIKQLLDEQNLPESDDSSVATTEQLLAAMQGQVRAP
jgi:hypothetical protein